MILLGTLVIPAQRCAPVPSKAGGRCGPAKRSSIRTDLERGGNTNLVGARNPAPEMPPRYGIRMARAGFCTMRLITLLLVHADTAVSFSRATSRTLISSSNSFFTVGHSTLSDGAMVCQSKRAAPRERPEPFVNYGWV